MTRTIRALVCALVFIVLLAAGTGWVEDYRARLAGEQHLLMNEIVDAEARTIERHLSRSLLAASFIALEIPRHGINKREFEELSRAIIDTLGGITNLQLAPGGVISDIYPLAGHEAALGLDILNHPIRGTESRDSVVNRRFIMVGPFELEQGGLGIIGRHPVFVEEGGVEKFWGFASVLIRLEDLLAAIDIDELEQNGYAYQVKQISPGIGFDEVFARSKMALTEPFFSTVIPLADSTWELSISRDSVVAPTLKWFGYLLATLVALLISVALFLILRQNQLLIEAQQHAEQATRERNAFLLSMSHEVRTPLTGLLGVCHLLKRTGQDPDQRRYVEAAAATCNKLLTVVNDLLDVARLDSMDFPLESVRFEIAELIEEVVNVAAMNAHAKGIDLVCDLDHHLPHRISGDPQRLRQVLNNLVSNAIEQTGSGEVLIDVKRIGDRIQFDICLRRAWTAEDGAQQGNPAGDRNMLISRRWIEAMGSELRQGCSSDADTCYSFELEFDPAKGESFDWNPPATLRNLSVCILSPNERRRRSLRNSLEFWNIERIEELDFDPDRDEFPADASPCDLVMVDQMGSSQGVNDLVASLRNSAAWREVRVIQLVPQGMDTSGSSADLCLSKPVLQSRLYDALMEILYRVSLESEFEAQATGFTPETNAPLAGRRLLLAEDNEINKIVALEILEETGAEVDVAVNGAEVVEMVRAQSYDLILMDIQMPVMDGYEASRRVRELGDGYADIPIVAMTAHAQEANRDKSIEAGMNHHVTKPFDPDALIRVVVDLVLENG